MAGQVLATITGLTLNSENYKKALNILIDRYGNPQVLISVHMETLIKITRVKIMENLEALRKLDIGIEHCMRKFNVWLLTCSTFERKILDELNMIIFRKFSGNVWTLELTLKYFNEELQAK